MKNQAIAFCAGLAFILTGCSAQSQDSGLLGQTSISNTTDAVIPELKATNSTIDCSGWTQDASTYLRNQGILKIDGVVYGIALFSCGAPDSELSTEFVESFIFTNGVWAGNGIVAGPRIKFMTMAPCESASEVRCKGVRIEDVDQEINGSIVIYQSDKELAWRFEPD